MAAGKRVWRPSVAPADGSEAPLTTGAKRRLRRERESSFLEELMAKVENIQTHVNDIAKRVGNTDADAHDGQLPDSQCQSPGGIIMPYWGDTVYYLEIPRVQVVEKIIEVPKIVIRERDEETLVESGRAESTSDPNVVPLSPTERISSTGEWEPIYGTLKVGDTVRVKDTFTTWKDALMRRYSIGEEGIVQGISEMGLAEIDFPFCGTSTLKREFVDSSFFKHLSVCRTRAQGGSSSAPELSRKNSSKGNT